MSTSLLKQLPKATVELEITIPWSEVKESYNKIVGNAVKEMEISGFRKGKAPKELVEKQLDKAKVYNEVIKDIIPNVYTQEIKKHTILPVSAPKVDVLKAKEGEDWSVKATIALKPKINLKNYKEKIRDLKQSKPKIWVPGKDEKKDEVKKPSLNEIMQALLSETDIQLSDMLVTEEVNRLLADLLDQTRKLGMTVEQYLIAKGKTSDSLRAEFALQAQSTLTLQFALLEIADKENITVSQKDIDDILAKVEKPEEKERLKADSYYLAHLIRQQKTIDFLSNL